jgi:DNA mismatch repair protein MutL
MGIIHVLPQELINQIAAGEVIERPASVVKELVENALDAGEKTISIDIEGGGIDLIRVADNGRGMAAEDIELAVLRHATSKIKETGDLFAIHTLGFRGEALPSIVSVSNATISTCTPLSSKGWMVSLNAGSVTEKRPKGMPAGTIVEIRDLFFNTPARKKFLKTSATEQRHIIDIISRYAIACPDRRFFLTVGGRTILNLREGSTLEERVKAIFGKTFGGKLKSFSREGHATAVHGIVASPGETRPNRSGIYTYVNNRSVKDQVLSSAIIEGYRGMLMKKRYPHAIVFIDIDPALVDVNVHPAKAEVRFQNSSAVFGMVVGAIRETLVAPQQTPAAVSEHKAGQYLVEETLPRDYTSRNEPGIRTVPVFQTGLFEETKTTYSDKRLIGTFLSTYLLLEDHSALYILDQHAAHERITYEKLKGIYTNAAISSQMLLTPVILELTAVEYSAFDEIAGYLEQIGIEVSPFGENTLAIRSLPTVLDKGDMTGIILELINKMLQGNLSKGDYLHDILATIACHASVRAGQSLSGPEAAALLGDLDGIGSPLTCPHGRPLCKKITLDEIERWIKRRP